jgi:uncharacterized protein (TIGR00725 family)
VPSGLSGAPRPIIGVIGSSADSASPAALAAAEAAGLAIARSGATLVTGGRSGVMEAASRGARAGDGLTIGILPSGDRGDANPHVAIAIPTGLGAARGLTLVRSSDAIILIGGGAGSLIELGYAYLELRRTIVLRHTGGLADRIGSFLIGGCYLDERRLTPLLFADDPEAGVAIALAAAATPAN